MKFDTTEFKTKIAKGRMKFASGSQRSPSDGKGAFELLSPFALYRLALIYEAGKKYGARNVEIGQRDSRLAQSAFRHFIQGVLMGDTEEDHMGQACWNIFQIMHNHELRKRGLISKDTDDLPKYDQKKNKEEWADFIKMLKRLDEEA